jgi:hypothetical protein
LALAKEGNLKNTRRSTYCFEMRRDASQAKSLGDEDGAKIASGGLNVAPYAAYLCLQRKHDGDDDGGDCTLDATSVARERCAGAFE